MICETEEGIKQRGAAGADSITFNLLDSDSDLSSLDNYIRYLAPIQERVF